MGCTLRGMSIPEREQIRLPNDITSSNIGSNSSITPVWNEITSTSDKSIQICHCGWSKFTTYRGLRIHQGKMKCTPKGMGIPEREQFRFKDWKYKNADSGPSIKIDNTLTPPYHSKSHQNTNNVRRALDFSTGAQQVGQLDWELPTTSNNHSSWPNAFQLMEKEKEAQKPQEMRQDMIRADLQQNIQTREQKISEVTPSVKDFKGGLDAECLEINSVFSEVMRVVEDSRKKALQPLEERRQRVDVRLDPTTAHECLVLPPDGKTVNDGGNDQKEGLQEVHYEEKKYVALTVPPVSLPLKEKPEKVGVFVDYEERFTECMFSDVILPYFSPHPKQNEKNSHPLIISPVKKQL